MKDGECIMEDGWKVLKKHKSARWLIGIKKHTNPLTLISLM